MGREGENSLDTKQRSASLSLFFFLFFIYLFLFFAYGMYMLFFNGIYWLPSVVRIRRSETNPLLMIGTHSFSALTPSNAILLQS